MVTSKSEMKRIATLDPIKAAEELDRLRKRIAELEFDIRILERNAKSDYVLLLRAGDRANTAELKLNIATEALKKIEHAFTYDGKIAADALNTIAGVTVRTTEHKGAFIQEP